MKLEAVRLQLGYIAEVNRRQMRKGETGTGGQITPSYAPGYKKYKTGLSSYHAASGTPDLFLSGTFQNKIKAFLSGSEYKLTSDDTEKLGKLTGKYGIDIFGINPKHNILVMSKATRQLGQLFKQATGL